MKRLPIAASLPLDVLFIITSLTSPRLNVYEVIRLSQVCHHWRDVLSSCPSLWTKIRIPDLNISLVTMMLTRSADYPLEVILHPISSFEMSPYYNLVFAHIHHVETFYVSGSCIDIEGLNYIISSLCEPPQMLPILKGFRLTLLMYPKDILKVPENLFHHAPNLKELHLSHVSVSYQMPIFKSITQLCLRDVAGITSFAQLMDILAAASANLQVLNLGHLIDLPPVSDSRCEITGRTRFPFLQSLTFANLGPAILMAVLDHVTVPPDIHWKVSCDTALDTPELDVTPLLSFSKITRTGSRLLLTMESQPDEMDIDFGDDFSGPYSASLLNMELSGNDNCVRRLQDLFTNLKFSNVSCCKIVIPWMLPSWLERYTETFGSFFSLFCGLQTLSIIGECNDGSSSLLDQLVPTETLPCPLLTDLTLKRVNTQNESWIQVLEKRKRAGNILTNIRVIANPDLSAAVVIELEKLAKNVLLT